MKKEAKGTIPKKTAALEVYKHLTMQKKLYLFSIVGSALVLIASNISLTVGSVSVVIMTAIFGFSLNKINKEMLRLNYIYEIEPPTKQNGNKFQRLKI